MSVRPATSTPDALAVRVGLPSGLARATVAILMGGRSSERDVSLSSGRTVLRALATADSPADTRGPGRVFGIEIQADGRWSVGMRRFRFGEAAQALEGVDLVFSALHGGEGENGCLQGLLTCCDIAFTGSTVRASAVAMDKVFARELVRARGLRVARGVSFSHDDWERGEEGLRTSVRDLARSGCVVKPRSGGSSVGCSLVHELSLLEPALAAAFLEEREVLVEELVPGVEATGGVLHAPTGELLALPPVEIRPRNGFFDYHEKYSADGARELCPPQGLSATACERVQGAAVRAHLALACEGYSRSDFIVPADGGEPVFLETNTLPGLTPRSLLPRAAAARGLDFRTLCLWIAAHGLTRARERAAR